MARALKALRARSWIFFCKRCLVGFPWFWPAEPAGEQAMVTIRRMIRRNFGGNHDPVQRTLAQFFTTTVWPFAVLVHLWRMRRAWGPEEIPIQRAPAALWAAIRHNVLPAEYYAYALWKPERKKNIDNYLYSHEAARVFRLLNRPSQIDPINDKLAFYEMCKAHALPSPEVLAAFAPSGRLLEFQSEEPPVHDLFVKPCIGFAGHGAERFRWRHEIFENEYGRRIRRQDLTAHLAERARKEGRILLVQPVLSNHANLHLPADSALATARIVTGCSVGDVAAIFGFIYFARSDRITAQHGNVALIDVASGSILLMPVKELSYPNPARQTNGAHVGEHLTLPDWHTALEYVKSAHRICANFAFVGWDIAFTNEGPMLLEGNANWSADEYQSLTGNPLGLTKFASLLAARLDQLAR